MAARKNITSIERNGEHKAVAVKQEASPRAENDSTICVALNRPYGVYFRMPDGRKVTLNGNGAPLIGKEKGVLPVGAYGLTIISAEDWEYILKTYGNGKLFKNGLCFAAPRKAEAAEEAESRSDLRNGLEPINPKRTGTKEAAGVE